MSQQLEVVVTPLGRSGGIFVQDVMVPVGRLLLQDLRRAVVATVSVVVARVIASILQHA
jgi:hypothetical protein